MKKAIFASIIMLATLTACQNESTDKEVLPAGIETMRLQQSGKTTTSDTIEITPRIQVEINDILAGTSSTGRLLCSVGVGSPRGHSCLEMWGSVYQYSWQAQGYNAGSGLGWQYYMHDDGSYVYNYSFGQNTNCNCNR